MIIKSTYTYHKQIFHDELKTEFKLQFFLNLNLCVLFTHELLVVAGHEGEVVGWKNGAHHLLHVGMDDVDSSWIVIILPHYFLQLLRITQC